MVDVIIFSFDRAMQLSLLLNSIREQDENKIFTVNVLFSFSSEHYGNAYLQLKEEYPEVKWIEEKRYQKEKFNFSPKLLCYWRNIYWWLKNNKLRTSKSNFRTLLIQAIDDAKTPFVMFLTDDSFFYKSINIPFNFTESIKENPLSNSFSFRHGANIPGGIFKEDGDFIHWNVYDHPLNTHWGYPFSVDGHVYSKEVMCKITRKITFNNPSTMEFYIVNYVNRKKYFSQVTALKENPLIGFELNQVQTDFDNNNMNISQEVLNKYFLEGWSLSIDANESEITSFRPKIDNVLVQREDSQHCLYKK